MELEDWSMLRIGGTKWKKNLNKNLLSSMFIEYDHKNHYQVDQLSFSKKVEQLG